MKIFLDNCVHYQAKGLFGGHDVLHACDIGWRELENGDLLIAAAAAEFDVMATTDKKIRHEHNLQQLPISVLELNTRFTRIEDLRTLEPYIDQALTHVQRYRFISVRPDGNIETLGDRST